MPRTKSLATLIEQYDENRIFKPRPNKIPLVYNILNRKIFNNRLKKPKIAIKRMHGALGLFEFNPYAIKYCHKITLNDKYLNFKEFVEILAHEMVHYYQKLILKQNTAKHNKEFYSFRKKFNKLGLKLQRVYR
ncbi:MAG: SprT-like domain-containing protein [Pelagibacteraceae bacterium]|jgi:hypothetical protein